MNKSESIAELAKSLCKFQAQIINPKNSAKNPQFNSKYAPLDVVINTVKPILSDNGLSFIQGTSSDGENIIITTLLMHESGEWIESDPLSLPAHQIKKGGAKEFNAQGAGSAITYGRRYSLSALLGISSEDDDDANGASTAPKPTQTNIPSVTVATLKAKWQVLAGTLDGFDKFYQEQQEKKYSNQQVDVFLTKKLQAKKESA